MLAVQLVDLDRATRALNQQLSKRTISGYCPLKIHEPKVNSTLSYDAEMFPL